MNLPQPKVSYRAAFKTSARVKEVQSGLLYSRSVLTLKQPGQQAETWQPTTTFPDSLLLQDVSEL